MKRVPAIQLLMIVMLLIAAFVRCPYDYYTVLKFVCCGGLGYLAVEAYKAGKQGWVWMLGVGAAMYNPFFKSHLGKSMWTLVNIATIIMLVVQIVSSNRRTPTNR